MAYLFPVEGEKWYALPDSATVPDIFRQQVRGWQLESNQIYIEGGGGVVIIYDLRCSGAPPSPFNRAWEVYAHGGQMSSCIELIRGPVIMLCAEGDPAANRDRVEKHYLSKLSKVSESEDN